MAISVTCDTCSTNLRVKDSAAGLKARCPRCQSVVLIPRVSATAASETLPSSPVVDAQIVGGAAEVDEDSFLSDAELVSVETLRPCPMCGEMVKPNARFCRYCDEDFDPPVREKRKRAGRERAPKSASVSAAGAQTAGQTSASGPGLIVNCDCGVAVRVPPERLGKQFACPQCQRGIALTVDGVRLPIQQLAAGETGTLCQICQTRIQPGEEYVGCPECKQVHHGECWAEVGGCGTYGCRQAPLIDKADAPAQPPTSAWGDTKNCPVCRRDIKAVALRCRHCGTDFDTADPLSRRELREIRRKKEESQQLNVIMILVFIASLFGCLAPITLIIGLAFLLPRRESLARSGPMFTILLFASLVVSTLYTLLIAGAILYQVVAG